MEETVRAGPREAESRRYRIVGVLGKGGFGTVYHGRLEGSDDFVKDVAIKLLTEVEPQPDTLTRFRDEARILGRLRDRAIVSVEPPTRLDGKWAVVMEYVDGVDCRRLLKERGPFPPTVALEIVEEVARALDALWQHPGDDGQPMRLLHRDLKPANVQLTPTGTVKLLDFGVAHARFAQRETSTTSHIGGTVGYIAPERLDGVEEQVGDVYSLGVMLEELLTGSRPSPGEDGRPVPTGDEALDDALALARKMRAPAMKDRPTAAEVERVCRELVRVHTGATLRDWARENVRRDKDASSDPLVGQMLSETILSQHSRAIAKRAGGSRPLLIAVFALLAALAALLVLFVGLGGAGAGLLLMRGGASEEPVARPVARPPPAPVVVPEPPPIEVAPAPVPVEEPVVARPRPAPAPSPSSATITVEGADDVVLVAIGGGRFSPGAVPAGTYNVQATFDGETVPAGTITVLPGGATRLRCDARFKRCMPR